MISDIIEDNEALLSMEQDDNSEWDVKFNP